MKMVGLNSKFFPSSVIGRGVSEPVDARDHEHVAAAEEVQDGAKLLASCGRPAAVLL